MIVIHDDSVQQFQKFLFSVDQISHNTRNNLTFQLLHFHWRLIHYSGNIHSHFILLYLVSVFLFKVHLFFTLLYNQTSLLLISTVISIIIFIIIIIIIIMKIFIIIINIVIIIDVGWLNALTLLDIGVELCVAVSSNGFFVFVISE